MAERIFMRNFDRPDSHTLATYRAHGGYETLPQGASRWGRRRSSPR